MKAVLTSAPICGPSVLLFSAQFAQTPLKSNCMYICIILIRICAIILGVMFVSNLDANWSFHKFCFHWKGFSMMMLDLLASKMERKMLPLFPF